MGILGAGVDGGEGDSPSDGGVSGKPRAGDLKQYIPLEGQVGSCQLVAPNVVL